MKTLPRSTRIALAVGGLAALLTACHSVATAQKSLPPLALAPNVDLPRFMGDGYVIASIPTFLEKGACDAEESYRLASDGSVDITFTYRKGDASRPLDEMRSRGFVQAPNAAVWACSSSGRSGPTTASPSSPTTTARPS